LLAVAQADISKWLAAGARLHNIAGQFALSDTAQAHLAVEKGDKLGTVIVDCTGSYRTGVVRSSLQDSPNWSRPSARRSPSIGSPKR
jgi:hypothetical protein